MKALILVGGYGTRMRPLTLSHPKSAFPFANKPMVQHQIEALARIGVVEVVIAINYQAEIIKHTLAHFQEKYKIKITYSQETQAMGTAGPIKLAESILKNNNETGLFIVCNSDVICDFPLEDMVTFHKSHGKQATLLLTEVADPSRFGVVLSEPDGKIHSFVEKPVKFIGNHINAGIYVLNLSVIDRIPQRFCMIQVEIFPNLAKEGLAYSTALKNPFWYDVGKPADYLAGQGAYLKYYNIKHQKKQNDNYQIEGYVLVDPSSSIGQESKVGPNVVIGPNCKIGKGCRLKNCTLIGDVVVEKGSYIENSIISWNCRLQKWSRIEGLSCLAEDVKVKEGVRLSECMVLSHKGVNQNTTKQILM